MYSRVLRRFSSFTFCTVNILDFIGRTKVYSTKFQCFFKSSFHTFFSLCRPSPSLNSMYCKFHSSLLLSCCVLSNISTKKPNVLHIALHMLYSNIHFILFVFNVYPFVPEGISYSSSGGLFILGLLQNPYGFFTILEWVILTWMALKLFFFREQENEERVSMTACCVVQYGASFSWNSHQSIL